jgi:hypothetical protein
MLRSFCGDAYELVDGRWALIADHPGRQNDTIELEDVCGRTPSPRHKEASLPTPKVKKAR